MKYKDLDPMLHAPIRLSIVSHLVKNEKSDFVELKEVTGATSGNMSVQLKKLEKIGYISIVKGFKNNYQYTAVSITHKGITAFEDYVNAIKKYIG